MPENLDAAQREPYTIPSTRRRRTSGMIHLAGTVAAAGAVVLGAPTGLLVVAGLLAVLALWSFAGAWRIGVLDPQALETAGREVGFPVGHASAAVSFDGLAPAPSGTCSSSAPTNPPPAAAWSASTP